MKAIRLRFPAERDADKADSVIVQGEKMDIYASDSSIVPMEDRSHAETMPSDPVLTRYNTVSAIIITGRPRVSGYIGNLKLKPRAATT